MSDQPSDQPSGRQGAGSLPELTPEQEAHVRRLLVEARHDEPVPADVAERLDRVLAGLTRDEPGSPGVAPVIDLAARRRRRNAAGLLAGAAAVIVAGFGIGQVIDVSTSDGDSAATSANADRESASDDKAASPRKPEESAGGGSGADNSQQVAPQPAGGRSVLTLRSRHLERDLTDQLGRLASTPGHVRSPAAEAFDAVGCTPPTPSAKFGPGELFPALFDGGPAVLALRPPADGKQQADVLACDTATSLASVTIPQR